MTLKSTYCVVSTIFADDTTPLCIEVRMANRSHTEALPATLAKGRQDDDDEVHLRNTVDSPAHSGACHCNVGRRFS